MSDIGSQGKAIPASVVGPNEGGRPVDVDKGERGECHCGHLAPIGRGNNVKPR